MSWVRALFGKKSKASVYKIEPLLSVQLPVDTETEQLFDDQIKRKYRSENILKQQGIPFIPHLPAIESENETRLRSASEVGERLIALAVIAGYAQADDSDEVAAVRAFVDKNDVRTHFSQDELRYFEGPDPNKQDEINFSWQFEPAIVMRWALNLCNDPLDVPNSPCDADTMNSIIDLVNLNKELASHGLRSKSEILDEADLIYRYHWAVRQTSIDGEPAPAGLDGGVVMERHRALNWLICSDKVDWDDVTTDT